MEGELQPDLAATLSLASHTAQIKAKLNAIRVQIS